MRALFPLALMLLAAAPAPDALRDRLAAEARACDPSALAFERTTKVVQSGGGSIDRTTRIERWDGNHWSLVSVNGKPPSESALHEAAKADAGVPGYHRLAALLAAGERSTDAQGRTVYRIDRLPNGSVPANGNDISSHLSGEAVIAVTNGQPWVQQLKLTAREDFKLNWFIKVKHFEQVSEYRLAAAGPRLVSQTVDSTGSMMGIVGGQHDEVAFAYR